MRRARPVLGTLVEIEAHTPRGESAAQEAIDAAYAEIADIHRRMSVHDPASELSELNGTASRRPVVLGEQTARVLATALRFAAESGGAFDPTVAGHLQALGSLPVHGDDALDPRARWSDVQFLDDRRVRFRRPLRVDLGGIAKGYAVDRALAVLRCAGVRRAIVNAGGDLALYGRAPQVIHLRDPASGRPARSLALRAGAIASSAATFSRRVRDGRMVSDLIDPRDGAPLVSGTGVSVVAGDCLTADALTKVVLFAPPAIAARVLAGAGARAIVQPSGAAP
ncbi:MAG: FAD:protein FMN transferase [Proteobacteria bacterium]|nr:FAD:protein FMN transferase [Pseudomonadota bacterium]